MQEPLRWLFCYARTYVFILDVGFTYEKIRRIKNAWSF